MIPDPRKAAIVWMWHADSGARADFDIVVYGVTAEDLLTVPNDIISSIAARHPGYVGSPFGVQTLRGKALVTQHGPR